ncbi:MAG TPA: hypothetical protein VLQ45_24885 [Thermoanaerobaculia bacterium]|nr:hypothetical protein [Thermoanaerobaculia bacterium]
MEPSTRPSFRGVAACCSRLRWNGLYVDVEPDPKIPNMRDGLFWCSHTMTCLGPDGRVATERHCCEGRRCFEPL